MALRHVAECLVHEANEAPECAELIHVAIVDDVRRSTFRAGLSVPLMDRVRSARNLVMAGVAVNLEVVERNGLRHGVVLCNCRPAPRPAGGDTGGCQLRVGVIRSFRRGVAGSPESRAEPTPFRLARAADQPAIAEELAILRPPAEALRALRLDAKVGDDAMALGAARQRRKGFAAMAVPLAFEKFVGAR